MTDDRLPEGQTLWRLRYLEKFGARTLETAALKLARKRIRKSRSQTLFTRSES
jgi:hypothetical protein